MQNFQNNIAKGTSNPNPFLGYGFVFSPKGISSRVRFNNSATISEQETSSTARAAPWNKTLGLNGSQSGTECRWGWCRADISVEYSQKLFRTLRQRLLGL